MWQLLLLVPLSPAASTATSAYVCKHNTGLCAVSVRLRLNGPLLEKASNADVAAQSCKSVAKGLLCCIPRHSLQQVPNWLRNEGVN